MASETEIQALKEPEIGGGWGWKSNGQRSYCEICILGLWNNYSELSIKPFVLIELLGIKAL